MQEILNWSCTVSPSRYDTYRIVNPSDDYEEMPENPAKAESTVKIAV